MASNLILLVQLYGLGLGQRQTINDMVESFGRLEPLAVLIVICSLSHQYPNIGSQSFSKAMGRAPSVARPLRASDAPRLKQRVLISNR